MASFPPDSHSKILGAQLSAVFRYGRILVPINVLNALLAALLYRGLVEPWILVTWLSVQAAFTAQRVWTLSAFFKDEASRFKTPPKVWARHAWGGAFFGGLLWAAWMLAWHSLALGILAVEGTILSCGALIIFSPYLPAFYAFCLPLTAAYAFVFFSSPLPGRPLGLGGIPFFLLLAAFAHLWNRNLRETYRLRSENLDLVENLRDEKAKVEEALAAKTRFLAVASHDLRQPLHAQGLFLHALKGERKKGSRRSQAFEKLETTHKALSSLLDGLLDLSLAGSGTLKPRLQAFPFRPLFSKLKTEFAPLARRKGLAFSASLPEGWTLSDPDLLARMLRNLLSNAVRYTMAGKVGLDCREEDGVYSLEVSDTGPGIPPGERENIFKEFYQIQNPGRDRAQGLGLGLSIVKSLGEALGHPVAVVSTPERGQGCLFTIRVPVAAAPETLPGKRKNRVPRFQGEAVLVVDDDGTIREGLAGLLKSWNLKPLAASSMAGALEYLGPSHDLKALLCDYRLGEGETGIDVIRRIRIVLDRELPSALVTGDTSPERLREAQDLGFPILFKPVDPDRLQELLETFLGRNGGKHSG